MVTLTGTTTALDNLHPPGEAQEMTSPVTVGFLSHLRSLYPSQSSPVSVLSNPWYIVSAVAFSASNQPEGVPRIFEHMLSQLREAESDTEDQRMLLARKLREALLKSGLISGYPKAINSLVKLHEVTPEELRDTQVQRSETKSLQEYESKGQAFWEAIYPGENNIYDMLYKVYPDLAWFSKTVGYGLVYGHMDILSQLETSYTLVAANIAGDTPQQISWHLAGAKRVGASSEDLQAVRTIAIEVGKHCGVQWTSPVPEIDL